jgi:plasmid stabilization system protein ParE
VKVRLSDNARSYLRKETEYLRKRSPGAAKDFVDRMRTARNNIATFTDIGSANMEFPVPKLRRLVVGEYLLDYEIGTNEINILAIRHGRQLPLNIEVESSFDFEDLVTPDRPKR